MKQTDEAAQRSLSEPLHTPHCHRKIASQSRTGSLLETLGWRILIHLHPFHPCLQKGRKNMMEPSFHSFHPVLYPVRQPWGVLDQLCSAPSAVSSGSMLSLLREPQLTANVYPEKPQHSSKAQLHGSLHTAEISSRRFRQCLTCRQQAFPHLPGSNKIWALSSWWKTTPTGAQWGLTITAPELWSVGCFLGGLFVCCNNWSKRHLREIVRREWCTKKEWQSLYITEHREIARTSHFVNLIIGHNLRNKLYENSLKECNIC